MGTQINLKLSDRLLAAAQTYVDQHGYENLQDFIREAMREKLFEGEAVSGRLTALASEKSLAKRWLTPAEDAAWQHLQKETSSSTPSPSRISPKGN